jgi:hypothetical protein
MVPREEWSTNPYILYEQSPPIQPISFIFVIDELKVAQCCVRYLQPRSRLANTYKDGKSFQTKIGHLSLKGTRRPIYRWENGRISHAAGYTYSNGSSPIEEYRAATMFYNRGFVVAEGNASAREMRKKPYPLDRWFDLLFRHDGDVSRVDLKGDKSYLAWQASQQLVDSLGLDYHQNKNQNKQGRAGAGLGGNLAILLGLIAFSCRSGWLDSVLTNSTSGWNNYKWTSPQYDEVRGYESQQALRNTNGRELQHTPLDPPSELELSISGQNGRGIVVSIYLDDQNPSGSTTALLHELEWKMGAILK